MQTYSVSNNQNSYVTLFEEKFKMALSSMLFSDTAVENSKPETSYMNCFCLAKLPLYLKYDFISYVKLHSLHIGRVYVPLNDDM